MSGKPQDPIKKFYSRIKKTSDDCWEWQGGLYSNGYARCRFNGKEHLVHRWAYETFIAMIPDGLHCHHVCYNRACVNPQHLELRTNRDNIFDKDSASTALYNMNKTHCKRGHEFNDHNTLVNKYGWRYCRTCHKERERSRRAGVKYT